MVLDWYGQNIIRVQNETMCLGVSCGEPVVDLKVEFLHNSHCLQSFSQVPL